MVEGGTGLVLDNHDTRRRLVGMGKRSLVGLSFNLKQGDERRWYPGVADLDGVLVRICGTASNGVPVLGVTYIAELLEPFPGKNPYPYTHVACFEDHLR